MFDPGKTRMIGLPYGEKKLNYDDMLSRFHLIKERYGQTDRQTDRQADRQICYYQYRASKIVFCCLRRNVQVLLP